MIYPKKPGLLTRFLFWIYILYLIILIENSNILKIKKDQDIKYGNTNIFISIFNSFNSIFRSNNVVPLSHICSSISFSIIPQILKKSITDLDRIFYKKTQGEKAHDFNRGMIALLIANMYAISLIKYHLVSLNQRNCKTFALRQEQVVKTTQLSLLVTDKLRRELYALPCDG